MASVKNCIHFKILFKSTTLLPVDDEEFININLYQQTFLLKIIYDFRIEISFIEKYKFLISKIPHSDIYFQLQ